MSGGSPERVDGVLVIGAGMAGLTAATELERRGVTTVVVDKGRAPGGRMASRTIGPARYDHGAQHFSARAPAFADRVAEWVEAGVAHEWIRSPSLTEPQRGTEPRFVGAGGMRAVPEHLAQGLDVRTGVTVESIRHTDDGVAAFMAGGDAIEASGLVLTPPLPQLLALLEVGAVPLPAATHRLLASVEYDPCLAVMAQLDGPSGLADDHVTVDRGPIAWMADNQGKGVSGVPAVTVHSTPDYAIYNQDEDPCTWAGELARAAQPHLENRIVAARAHTWRYSRPRTTLDEGAVSLPVDPPVVLAGEVFAGARVEGAFLSGLAAAEQVLDAR